MDNTETKAGIEPAYTALQAAPSPLGHKATRTPDWNRTSDLQVRNLALSPLSYEGMVWETGFEPAQTSNGFTDRPDSPASALPDGVTDRNRR